MKIKITMKATKIIEINNFDDYDCTSFEKFVEVSEEGITQDPFAFIDCIDIDVSVNIKKLED